jgi:hypothetical protein
MKNVFGDAPDPPFDPPHPPPPEHDQLRTPILDLGNDLIGRVTESMSDLDRVTAVLE